ncbi:hypothetical protein [Bifidobacterium aemilianum]|nr:hypothetical protein [Bifidobacterium aemilianum]
MLAYNNRISTEDDEIRMDFVLRVAHGDVDPTCRGQVPVGGTPAAGSRAINNACGNLGFLYSYYGGHDGTKQWGRINYIRTMADDGGKQADSVDAVSKWASNWNQFYTIHSLMNSGEYDYMTISIEADINYPDNNSGLFNKFDKGVAPISSSNLGGTEFPQWLYAFVGQDAGYWGWVPNQRPGATYGNGNIYTNDTSQFTDSSIVSLSDQIPAQLYEYSLSDPKASNTGKHNGPIAFIGWDNLPLLWSKGQANWGLVTDYGFKYTFDYADGKGSKEFNMGEGVAPPRSFFVYWNNPAYKATYRDAKGLAKPYPCSKTTSFYYQWVGLKDGNDWVPVSALTPTVQRVDGQVPNTHYWPPAIIGGAGDIAAFNAPSNGAHTSNTLMSTGEAQKADGSIDFKTAKAKDGLDGYFKLVTWPITTNADGSVDGCATGDWGVATNPAAGITDGMAQPEVQKRIGEGWTVDTAYYKYTVPLPENPTIDAIPVNGFSSTLTPAISGTGTASAGGKKYRVDLFREDPGKPINASEPDDYDTEGVFIGSVQTDASGHWSIKDGNADGKNTDGSKARYHARLVELNDGYELASGFSNIADLFFNSTADPAPSITQVLVPHTVDGSLPGGAVVKVSGTASPRYEHSVLKLYVQSKADKSAQPRQVYSETIPTGGHTVSWSTDLATATFPQSWADLTYVFTATLTSSTDLVSDSGEKTDVVDVTPPDPGVTLANWTGVHGTALNGQVGSASAPQEAARMKVSWPDRSSTGYEVGNVSGSDGSWQVSLPAAMKSGDIGVWAKDSQGNESAKVEYKLNSIPPVKALPFTGRQIWSLLGGTASLIAALVLVAILLARHKRSGLKL